MADDARYNIMKIIKLLLVQNKYTTPRFICQNFELRQHINNQEEQVADVIECDICLYLVSSDKAGDDWYNYA